MSPASEKQLNANRQNALLSTGPRTDKGKAISRGNSLKHGLCANPAAGVSDDSEAFGTWLRALVKQIQPRNIIEEGLVHRIAVSLWRLQKSARIESAVSGIARAAVAPARERIQHWIKEIGLFFECQMVEVKDPQKRPPWLAKNVPWYVLERPGLATLDKMLEPSGEIMCDASALMAMHSLLLELRLTLRDKTRRRYFSPANAQMMAWLLGSGAERYEPAEPSAKNEWRRRDDLFYPDEEKWADTTDRLIGNARKSEQEGLPPELDDLIHRRLLTLRTQAQQTEQPATLQNYADRATAALLPDSATLDRLLRYESHADRTLHRTLEMLAKLRGATVETVLAKVCGTAADGSTFEFEGQRTRWGGHHAAHG